MDKLEAYIPLIYLLAFVMAGFNVVKFIKQMNFGELHYKQRTFKQLNNLFFYMIVLVLAILSFEKNKMDFNLYVTPLLMVIVIFKAFQGVRIYDEGLVIGDGIYKWEDMAYYDLDGNTITFYFKRQLIPGCKTYEHKVDDEAKLMIFDRFREFGIKEKNDENE